VALNHLILIGYSMYKINYISHAFYLGQVIGSIFIARIPDLYGRKWPFVIAIAAQFPFYLGLILSRNFILTNVLAFMVGVMNVGIYNGAYIMVCEYVHTPLKNKVCTVLLFFDNFTIILICLYFKFVTRYWLWFQILGVCINLIAAVGVYFLPETPEYLYCFYRFSECKESLLRIQDWNDPHKKKRQQGLPEEF